MYRLALPFSVVQWVSSGAMGPGARSPAHSVRVDDHPTAAWRRGCRAWRARDPSRQLRCARYCAGAVACIRRRALPQTTHSAPLPQPVVAAATVELDEAAPAVLLDDVSPNSRRISVSTCSPSGPSPSAYITLSSSERFHTSSPCGTGSCGCGCGGGPTRSAVYKVDPVQS